MTYYERQKNAYDRGVLSEAKKLEKMLDIELEDYLNPKNQVKQGDLFD